MVAASLFSNPGCCCFDDDDESPAGTVPVAEELPPLELRDDTPDILITWVDEKGNHHVVQRPTDVPENGRELVRVVTTKHGDGELLYVADLRVKNTDGTYTVKTIPRGGWELVAQQRRQKTMAGLAPSASTLPTSTKPATTAPASANVSAIVYSTAWCGVCRNAEKYLRSKNVTVVMKDIEKSSAARNEMNQKLRKAGLRQDGSVPVIDIRGRVLKGFVQRDIDRAIKDSTSGDVL